MKSIASTNSQMASIWLLLIVELGSFPLSLLLSLISVPTGFVSSSAFVETEQAVRSTLAAAIRIHLLI